MSTKILSGTYPAGYYCASAVYAMTITATGYVEGAGVGHDVSKALSVYNFGRVNSTQDGFDLQGGGDVHNEATGTILTSSATGSGVYSAGNCFVDNRGSIGTTSTGAWGVKINGGGGVHNYGSGVIEAGGGVVVSGGTLQSVSNQGQIIGHGVASIDSGVALAGSGSVTNGTGFYTRALIEGYSGIVIAGATSTVVNLGTVEARGASSGVGVHLVQGGKVTNGTAVSNQALIRGARGVVVDGLAATVTNFGTVIGDAASSGQGVEITAGGTVTNGSAGDTRALIEGYVDGVLAANAAASVRNFGTVQAAGPGGYGVSLAAGGQVTNGSATDTSAVVEGGFAGVAVGAVGGAVVNFGAIRGVDNYGVFLGFGGTVTNGSAADSTALIQGYDFGISSNYAAANVHNFGIVESGAYVAGAAAVTLYGGSVTNGSAFDHSATIQGYYGIEFANGGGAGTVSNFGSILSTGAAKTSAVVLVGGGALANGSTADTQALVRGGSAVMVTGGAGTIANFGTLQSTAGATSAQGGYGIQLAGGGSVSNGAYNDTVAVIEGYRAGVAVTGSAAQVLNFGTIRATGGYGDYGVAMSSGGFLSNGSVTDSTALISGFGGIFLAGATAVNYGVIQGTGVHGAVLGAGASLTNGGSADATAVIKGFIGVYSSAANATVTNFGTIIGAGGQAVLLQAPSDMLAVAAGAIFVGAVSGGGGTLDLAGGAGTITSLLVGGAVKVSSCATTFNNFGTLEIGAGANFTAPAIAALAAGQGLIVAGTLTEAGTLTSAGTVSVSGVLAGTGSLSVTGGSAAFTGSPSLTIAKVAQSGGVISIGAAVITAGDVWTQAAGAITALAGDQIRFTGTGDVFSGALSGAGTINFLGGTDLISAATLSGTRLVIGGAQVTLSGAIALSGTLTATTPNLAVAAAGATLTGAGSLILTNLATNMIKGASGAATLTNAVRILGAGDVGGGQMTLVNQAGGLIEANQSTALVIDTGVNAIANAGTMESAATGGLTLMSAAVNSGSLTVIKGVLLANGAVTGTGSVKIGGGVADFAGAFSQNVAFTSTTGVLELAKSQTYTGQISGFSKTGGTSLDLVDIGFAVATTHASFTGSTISGTLTITDGTHTAHIGLVGDYTASSWFVSSDGHGGTTVIDPPHAPAPSGRIAQGLIGAAASFGVSGSPGGTGARAADTWWERQTVLSARPGYMA